MCIIIQQKLFYLCLSISVSPSPSLSLLLFRSQPTKSTISCTTTKSVVAHKQSCKHLNLLAMNVQIQALFVNIFVWVYLLSLFPSLSVTLSRSFSVKPVNLYAKSHAFAFPVTITQWRQNNNTLIPANSSNDCTCKCAYLVWSQVLIRYVCWLNFVVVVVVVRVVIIIVITFSWRT